MNIKTVTTHSLLPVDPKPRVDGGVRTQSSTERDAQGQQEQAQPELKRHLTPEELAEAIKLLEESPGIKANHLTLRVEQREDSRTILILDPAGSIVRRLSENQLWQATRDKDRQTGRILDKAM